MMLQTRLVKEVLSMAQQARIIDESQSYGQATWTLTLVLSKQPCACSLSKCQGCQKQVSMRTVLKTSLVTHQSIDAYLPSCMIILNRTKNYCDYCKMRYGVTSLKGQVIAIFTAISSYHKSTVKFRNYCKACRDEVEAWADGSTWTLEQQQAYAKGLEEIDYGIF